MLCGTYYRFGLGRDSFWVLGVFAYKASAFRFFTKGPCTQIVRTLAPKDDFRSKVWILWGTWTLRAFA